VQLLECRHSGEWIDTPSCPQTCSDVPVVDTDTGDGTDIGASSLSGNQSKPSSRRSVRSASALALVISLYDSQSLKQLHMQYDVD
jgi:hypothetical protein